MSGIFGARAQLLFRKHAAVPRNMATFGTMMTTGDFIIQYFEQRELRKPQPLSFLGDRSSWWKPERSVTVGSYGCFNGLFWYVWYGQLDKALSFLNATPKKKIVASVLCTAGFTAPIINPIFFAWIVIRGPNPSFEKFKEKVTHDLFPLIQMSWSYWIPVNIINFTFIPLELRVFWVSCGAVVWAMMQSYMGFKDPKKKGHVESIENFRRLTTVVVPLKDK